MKIREKLIISVNLLLFTVFFIILLLNKIYIERIYIIYKKYQLKNIYKEIMEKDSETKFEVRKEIEKKYEVRIFHLKKNQTEMMMRRNNKKYFIVDEHHKEPTPDDRKIRKMFMETPERSFNQLEKGKIVIEAIKNRKTAPEALVLLFKNKINENLVIVNPLTNIREVIDILTFFSYFLLIVCLLAAGIALSIFSYGLAKPLIKLKQITNKMSNLDFSEKIDIKSGDEVEELGNSINNLSTQLETNINRLKADIKEKERINEIQRKFFSTVSHELKTPLAVIKGYAVGLKDNIAPEKADFYCEVISEEVEEMSNLITTLLNKMKYENKNIKKEKFNLNQLVNEVIEKHKIDLSEKNIDLSIDMAEDNYIIADKESIKSVILNFYINALSFVSNSGKIKIKISNKNEKTIFSIFNTGNHIPEENLNDIWKPFFRVEDSQSRKYGGTGLGLSIVSDILKKHSGKYGVENKKNGVEFYFEI